MKKTRFFDIVMFQLKCLVVLSITLTCLSGCSTVIEEPDESGCKMVKRELIFNNDNGKTRGLFSQFPDKAQLYLHFYANKYYDWAKATYSASENKWTIEFPEEILTYGSGTCRVAYVQTGNIEKVDAYGSIYINDNTSLLGSRKGEWKVRGNTIIVTALLEPLFSRIRFVSDTPTEIWVKGFGQTYGYDFWNGTYLISASSMYSYSLPCSPKYISVKQGGQDGKFYSEYFYTPTNSCFPRHGGECAEDLKLSIYYPSETTSYYYKKLEEFKAGNSYLVRLPTTSNYSGWTKGNNIIRTISSEIKIGDGSNTSHSYRWEAGAFIYGKSVNFELSSNGGDGFVYISGTEFGYEPIGAYSGVKYSALCDESRNGILVFNFNVSSITKYYTKFQNVTLSHFPIYELYGKDK